MAIEQMTAFMEKVLSESALPSITEGRLKWEYPESDWKYNGNFLHYQDELFLQFADTANRRMWWVRVDDNWDGESAMTWDISEVPELV